MQKLIQISLFTVLWICIGCCYFSSGRNKQMEQEHVGTYLLKNYPNCDLCIAILNKDNTFQVMDKHIILENGEWHFEAGCDFLIVYLNNKKDQLGSGRFDYSYFIDRSGKKIQAAQVGL